MNSKVQELLTGARGNYVIPQRAQRAVATDVQKIPLSQITPDPDNARKTFDADELAALAEDLKRHGQMQNAVVFELDTPGAFQLVAGERRWRACQLAGLPSLLCLVLPRDMAREVREEMAFAENMARADLRPVEVARHWAALMERWGCSTRELAARVGVAPSTICKRLALLKLDADTQQAVDAGTVHQSRAVETTRTRRRARGGRRAPRGVVETVAAGSIRLKRGHTLATLIAELQSMDTGQAEAVPAAA